MASLDASPFPVKMKMKTIQKNGSTTHSPSAYGSTPGNMFTTSRLKHRPQHSPHSQPLLHHKTNLSQSPQPQLIQLPPFQIPPPKFKQNPTQPPQTQTQLCNHLQQQQQARIHKYLRTHPPPSFPARTF